VDPATRKVVYVGHSKDVSARMETHWKHRRSPWRNQDNPQFYGWLQSLLFCPGHRILAVVPYGERYQREREWTLKLRKTCDLFNISDGAAPLKRGPLSEAERSRLVEMRARPGVKKARGRPAGYRHTPETRAKMAASRRAYWAGKTPEERSAVASVAARAQQDARKRRGGRNRAVSAAA